MEFLPTNNVKKYIERQTVLVRAITIYLIVTLTIYSIVTLKLQN